MPIFHAQAPRICMHIKPPNQYRAPYILIIMKCVLKCTRAYMCVGEEGVFKPLLEADGLVVLVRGKIDQPIWPLPTGAQQNPLLGMKAWWRKEGDWGTQQHYQRA